MNRQQWESHFTKQRESNLTIIEYCSQHQLKYKNFVNAQYRYKSETTKSSFISVVTEHSQTHLSNDKTATIELCYGQTKATLENCTPQWFAQFIKEVM